MKILWLKNELLHPIDKGGKIRSYEMLRQLKQHHHVTYVCLQSPNDTAEAVSRASEYCNRLVTAPWQEPARFSFGFYVDLGKNLISPLPYVIEKYRSAAMAEAIARELGSATHDVLVCDFLTPSVNLTGGVDCPSVLFQHNVESILWKRQVDTAQGLAKRMYFRAQWWKLRRYEHHECHRHDWVAAVSDNDALAFRELFGVQDVVAVPTGVDTEYFQPLDATPPSPSRPAPLPREPSELVFTGSMDWMPNEDAILYFADQILPRVAQAVPEVKVTVVGRNPTPKLLGLGQREPRIQFTGRVDDVRPYIDRCAAFIVPLRVGGGTRIKIYEAMAMQRAVISTRIGAEGLPVREGVELLLADDPAHFAAQVIAVLRDDALRVSLEQKAREAVCARFGWDRATEAFAEVCQKAIAKHAARTRARARVAA